MKRLATIALALLLLASSGWALEWIHNAKITGWIKGPEVEHVWLWNDTLGNGSWVVWMDSFELSAWCTATAGTDTFVMDDTFNWGPRFKLGAIILPAAGATQACTLCFIGEDTAGARLVDTVTVAINKTVALSAQWWTDFDTLLSWDAVANDSWMACAWPYMTVTRSATANDPRVAGVLKDSMIGKKPFSATGAVDGYGVMYVSGPCQAYIDCAAAEGRVGMSLYHDSETAYAVPVENDTVIGSLGRETCGELREAGSVKGKYRVYVQTGGD